MGAGVNKLSALKSQARTHYVIEFNLVYIVTNWVDVCFSLDVRLFKLLFICPTRVFVSPIKQPKSVSISLTVAKSASQFCLPSL